MHPTEVRFELPPHGTVPVSKSGAVHQEVPQEQVHLRQDLPQADPPEVEETIKIKKAQNGPFLFS
jgi:hypothetical protein